MYPPPSQPSLSIALSFFLRFLLWLLLPCCVLWGRPFEGKASVGDQCARCSLISHALTLEPILGLFHFICSYWVTKHQTKFLVSILNCQNPTIILIKSQQNHNDKDRRYLSVLRSPNPSKTQVIWHNPNPILNTRNRNQIFVIMILQPSW